MKVFGLLYSDEPQDEVLTDPLGLGLADVLTVPSTLDGAPGWRLLEKSFKPTTNDWILVLLQGQELRTVSEECVGCEVRQAIRVAERHGCASVFVPGAGAPCLVRFRSTSQFQGLLPAYVFSNRVSPYSLGLHYATSTSQAA